MRRTVAAHSNFFGPLDGTSALHDIPLGRYEVTASLVGADGSRSPLLLSTLEATTPAESVEVTFDPRLIVETLSVGYSSSRPAITVHEGNG
jgi:hypothetical protein